MEAVKKLIRNLERRVRPLSRAQALASWNAQVTGKPEHEEESARIQLELARIWRDADLFSHLKEFRTRPIEDPLVRRQVEILYRASLSLQIPFELVEKCVALDTRVNLQFNHFRAERGGRKLSENDVIRILQESHDEEERRETWIAQKAIGPGVAPLVLELVTLRNEGARALGYENFYSMSLDLNEIDETRLFGLFDSFAAASDEPFKKVIDRARGELQHRYGLKSPELHPWHFQDLFFQKPPRLGELSLNKFFRGRDPVKFAREFYQGIGFDIEGLLSRADLYEKEGKCQHAFCCSIDKKEDIRILANLRDSEVEMLTLLHELGHGLYEQHLSPRLPYFLRDPAHTLSTEAIALMFDRFTKNPDFLVRIAGAQAAEIEALAGPLKEVLAWKKLVFGRWCLVICQFEREMYRNPGSGLDTLWWDLVEKYQWIRRPPGRSAPDWATKIHLAQCPVYYQNYLLGEMIASQLNHHLVARYGAPLVGKTGVSRFLISRIFKQGARRNWEEAIEFACGEPFSPEYFVRECF